MIQIWQNNLSVRCKIYEGLQQSTVVSRSFMFNAMDWLEYGLLDKLGNIGSWS